MCRGPRRKVPTVLRIRIPAGDGGDGADARPEIDAVLLDMDGTLVNSNAAVERNWTRWALAHDVDPQAIVAVCHGATTQATITRFRPDLDDETVESMSRDLMDAEVNDVEGVVPMPGAPALVAWLDSVAAPWAVVTNADHPLCKARLEAAGIEAPLLVTVEEVPVGKPDPALYLLAARRLDVDIARCLVVEDSPAGVEAGQAAGALVAALERDDGDVRIADLHELLGLLDIR